MNFKHFYHAAENRLKESIISLWATGEAEMQKYFTWLLEKEGLMAEPVFQTAFPWEPAEQPFEATGHIFDDNFIAALDAVQDGDYRFPKSRFPYKHQVASWDALLNQRRSIAVTTGTGSGKTECFMLPVLYDIYKNSKKKDGINALFLYPLNALIGSQKKRIDTWCRALGGLHYAVYNGHTDEKIPAIKATQYLPELVSRKQIRETPPQILFTNPSMLEYMLVRNKDVELLNNSKGSLRWILLDEAHTLTGSAAAEMALLIRRVVDAFEVDIRHLRFAITSATVGAGGDSEPALKKFMSHLCGISEDQITVISGRRVVSQILPEPRLQIQRTALKDHAEPALFREVQSLRQTLLARSLTLSEIGTKLGAGDRDHSLTLIDQLGDHQQEGKSILPLRGHFFARGIGGVFVCTDSHCREHSRIKPETAIGTMTTIAGSSCQCGAPLLELVACRSCGNQFLESEKKIDHRTHQEVLQLVSAVAQDLFAVDQRDEDDEEDTTTPVSTNKFYFTRNREGERYHQPGETFAITKTGEKIGGDQFIMFDDGLGCPHCGQTVSEPLHFRISSSFINRVLADVILEETPATEAPTQQTLWEGHKYISFTDSRQGTAKISAIINQDKEGTWVRAQVYHKLCKLRSEKQSDSLPPEEVEELLGMLREKLAAEKHRLLQRTYQEQIDSLEAGKEASRDRRITLTWDHVRDLLSRQHSFRTLYNGNNPNDPNPRGDMAYLNAILYDQFARRLPRERSLENLGMVSLIYPKIEKTAWPQAARTLSITKAEWRDLLKIAADYVIRFPVHLSVNPEIYDYTTAYLTTKPLYEASNTLQRVRKWPIFRRRLQNHRLSLLICAGLGLHDPDDIDQTREDEINDLLSEIWKVMKTLLTRDNDAFKLNLEAETQFVLSENLWLCPVKRRLVDAQFRGYSPWIKGNLSWDNIRHYRITTNVTFPNFPYPYNLDEDNNINLDLTRRWIAEKTGELRQAGVWNNLHEQILLNRPLYLSGEHSAQQHEQRLKDLEGQFERSEINILNCSTTMEMGVDIGGISAVVMNNVPPSPANYLQRAGRAGRRSEARSLAFTICTPNPIGLHAMQEPLWALNHQIAPPLLSFNSALVIERHLNAFFLGKFVQTDAVRGLDIKMNTERFFFLEPISLALMFQNWLQDPAAAASYQTSLQQIIRQTSFADKHFSFLLEKVIGNFEELSCKTIEKKEGFDAKLLELNAAFGENSPAYKTVLFQRRQFLSKNVITYLAEQGFLPSAGLPTGVVEFETVTIKDIKNLNDRNERDQKRKSMPSYFITRALSEFAPGNEVVIDGKSYASAGIIMENDRGVQAERQIIQSCTHCGYQRALSVARDEDPMSVCPHCKTPNLRGIDFGNGPRLPFSEMIQPAGFAVDVYENPTRKIKESSSVQYVDPLLMNIRPWQNESTALFETRESEEDAEILFYNVGAGQGYSVCLHCGRTVTDPDRLLGHRRLRGGRNNEEGGANFCTGNDHPYAIKGNVILGGRFKTDFCEIRIKDEQGRYSADKTLLYTLGTVLSKQLAHFLAVEEAEISFGVKNYEGFSTIFIFDTAKGGAGYASQFISYADQIFAEAYQVLKSCLCEQACTKCLIDRNTQWHMDRLDKRMVIDWLKRVANSQIPNELSEGYLNLQVLSGGIRNEIGRLRYLNKIKKIRVFGQGDPAGWDLDHLPAISKLRGAATIEIVLNDQISAPSIQDKISMIQLSSWAELKAAPVVTTGPLKKICELMTEDGLVTAFLATDFESTFNGNWGNASDGRVYKQPIANWVTLETVTVPIDEQGMAAIYITQPPQPVHSDGLARLFIDALGNKIKLHELMQNRSFRVIYSDRYLKTPFGCLLLVQFIQQLSVILNFSIEEFIFKGQEFTDERAPRMIFHNYQTAVDRNQAVIDFAAQMNIFNAQAINGDLPHFRYFEFESDELMITIRPDAGIEHGWFVSDQAFKQYNGLTGPLQTPEISQKVNGKPLLYTVSVERL